MKRIVTIHQPHNTSCRSNNIINKVQDGFRKQLSFEAQLVEFIDDITRNNNRHTDCLIMGFSQASTVFLFTNLINMESKEKNKCTDKRLSFWQNTVRCHRRGDVWHHTNRIRSSTGINRGTLSLFTDDTIAYLTLSKDSSTLKENLNKLATWEEKWMMQCNSGKCVVLPITKRTKQYK